MKKTLIIGGAVVVFVVVIVLVMLGNIDSIVKSGVERVGPMILKAPVSLESVDISVFSGSGELQNFTVGNPKGYKTDYAFHMDLLKVDLDVGSVNSDRIHVNSLIIDSPSIIFEGKSGKSNLSQLQANAETFTEADKEKQKSAQDSQGKELQIDYARIQNANISVSMDILQGKKLTIPLPPLELRDIGKDKGVSISDALGELLGAVNNAVIPAVQSQVANIGGGTEKAGEAVQKGFDKIKGLFGK